MPGHRWLSPHNIRQHHTAPQDRSCLMTVYCSRDFTSQPFDSESLWLAFCISFLGLNYPQRISCFPQNEVPKVSLAGRVASCFERLLKVRNRRAGLAQTLVRPFTRNRRPKPSNADHPRLAFVSQRDWSGVWVAVVFIDIASSLSCRPQ